jgi:hypothetical protein
VRLNVAPNPKNLMFALAWFKVKQDVLSQGMYKWEYTL